MSETSQTERRWSDRRDIYTDIKVIFHQRSYFARTHDIGLGGMFIDLNYVLIPRHAHVKIVMVHHRQNGKNIVFHTRVAYVTPYGYGLEFVDFDTRDVHLLQDVLFDSTFDFERLA